jgi:hypothetical protein
LHPQLDRAPPGIDAHRGARAFSLRTDSERSGFEAFVQPDLDDAPLASEKVGSQARHHPVVARRSHEQNDAIAERSRRIELVVRGRRRRHWR